MYVWDAGRRDRGRSSWLEGSDEEGQGQGRGQRTKDEGRRTKAGAEPVYPVCVALAVAATKREPLEPEAGIACSRRSHRREHDDDDVDDDDTAGPFRGWLSCRELSGLPIRT